MCWLRNVAVAGSPRSMAYFTSSRWLARFPALCTLSLLSGFKVHLLVTIETSSSLLHSWVIEPGWTWFTDIIAGSDSWLLPSFGSLHGAFWKLVLKEKVFRSVLAQGPPGSVSEVCGVFNDRDLPSTSRRPVKTIAITCNVVGVSWTTLSNNSKESLSCLELGFCQTVFGFWREHCQFR